MHSKLSLQFVALGSSCDSLTSVTFLISAPGAVNDDISHMHTILASSVSAMCYHPCTSGGAVAGTRSLRSLTLHLVVSPQVTVHS